LDAETVKINKELVELNENPQIERDYKLQQREEFLGYKKSRISSLKNDIEHLKNAIVDQDKEAISEYIPMIDSEITEHYAEVDFFDPLRPFHEFFSELFEVVLGMNIEKDYDSTLQLVPTEKWIELYKKIDANSVKKAISSTQDDPKDSETVKGYTELTRAIRDILKSCIATGSELKVSDGLYETDQPESTRTKEIREKFIKK